MTASPDTSDPLRGAGRALAILLLAAVAAFAYEYLTSAAEAVRTEGVVIEAIREPSGPTGDPEALVVRFEHDGRPYQLTTSRTVFQQWSGDHRVGGTVPVAYLPGEPSNARLDDVFHRHPASVTMLVVAGILLVVIVVLSRQEQHRRRSRG